jgi:hypothetical protein
MIDSCRFKGGGIRVIENNPKRDVEWRVMKCPLNLLLVSKIYNLSPFAVEFVQDTYCIMLPQ